MAGTDRCERLDDSWIAAGVVELMHTVVLQEELKGAAEEIASVIGLAVEVARIAERASHQHCGPVTDVARDQRVGQLGLSDVRQRRIHSVTEVQ